MYEDTDYDALERNVKYIPWKGKKEEWYTWHKTFLVRAMMRGYHGILVGLELVPSDEAAKMLQGLGSEQAKKLLDQIRLKDPRMAETLEKNLIKMDLKLTMKTVGLKILEVMENFHIMKYLSRSFLKWNQNLECLLL